MFANKGKNIDESNQKFVKVCELLHFFQNLQLLVSSKILLEKSPFIFSVEAFLSYEKNNLAENFSLYQLRSFASKLCGFRLLC